VETTGRIVSERAFYNYENPASPPILELTIRTPQGKFRLRRTAHSRPYCFIRKNDFNPNVEQAIRFILQRHHDKQLAENKGKVKKTVWIVDPLFVPLSKEDAIVFGSKDEEVVQIFVNDKQQVKLVRDYLGHRGQKETKEGEPVKASKRGGLYKFNDPAYDEGWQKHKELLGQTKPEILEADITFTRRWKIDTGVFNAVRITDEAFLPYSGKVPAPEVGYWDLETNDSRGKPQPGIDEVRSWALSKKDREWVFAEDDEADTISLGKSALEKYCDVVIGWGSEKFDQDVITKRQAVLSRGEHPKLKPDPFYFYGFQMLDLLQILYDEGRIEGYIFDSYRLERVVQEVLVKHGFYPKTIERPGHYEQLFQTDRKRIKEINLSHARAVRDLDAILGFTALKVELSDLAGIEITDTEYTNRMVDTLIMRRICNSKPRLVVQCRRDEAAGIGESYGGAMVFPPVPGLFHNILHFDLVSMYVRIIQAFNVSPELWWKAKEDGLDKPEGLNLEEVANPEVTAYFDKVARWLAKQPIGVFPLEIAEANKTRQRIKDNMEEIKSKSGTDNPEYKRAKAQYMAIKGVLNAFYGLIGSLTSRFYNHVLAGFIPWAGREIILKVKQAIEYEFGKRGVVVLYGDTDSLFVDAPESMGEEIKNFINDEIFPALFEDRWDIPSERRQFKPRNFAEIGFEEVDADIYFTDAKKRYFYRIKDPKTGKTRPQIEVVGLEAIRSDACPIARLVQDKMLNMVLDGTPREQMKAYLRDTKEKILGRQIPSDQFIMARGMRKDVGAYGDHQPIFVKVFLQMQKDGVQLEGKVNWVITKATKSKILDFHYVTDFENVPQMDTGALAYYWTHYILPPADRVMDLKKEEFDELKYVAPQMTENLETARLTSFFEKPSECS
jgi:DNA polymerase elongation subunit (family B)